MSSLNQTYLAKIEQFYVLQRLCILPRSLLDCMKNAQMTQSLLLYLLHFIAYVSKRVHEM